MHRAVMQPVGPKSKISNQTIRKLYHFVFQWHSKVLVLIIVIVFHDTLARRRLRRAANV